ERGARVRTFEIILGAEKALAPGLALAAGDRAKAVEAFGDRRKKAFFPLYVGCNRAEQRRLRLVGAVRTAKALNGGVGFPAGLEQIMHALSLVPHRKIGVVAAPRAAGIRKDEDAFFVIHETLRLGEVRRSGARLGHKPCIAVRGVLLHDAAISARDFRNTLNSKMMQELVERGLHSREGGEFLEQPVANLDCFARLHRLTIKDNGA